MANEKGIHGRTIDFVGMKDDKISAQTSAQLARELVQQDQVFALAPVVSPVFGAGDFLEQEGVPYLGWGVTAAFCGNVGLKPSFGRVPAYPLSPFGTVSHLGPHTMSVADAALMLGVLQRPDPRDWTSLPPTDVDPSVPHY